MVEDVVPPSISLSLGSMLCAAFSQRHLVDLKQVGLRDGPEEVQIMRTRCAILNIIRQWVNDLAGLISVTALLVSRCVATGVVSLRQIAEARSAGSEVSVSWQGCCWHSPLVVWIARVRECRRR